MQLFILKLFCMQKCVFYKCEGGLNPIMAVGFIFAINL